MPKRITAAEAARLGLVEQAPPPARLTAAEAAQMGLVEQPPAPVAPAPRKAGVLEKALAFLSGQPNPTAADELAADPTFRGFATTPAEKQALRESTDLSNKTLDAYSREGMLKGALSFLSGGGPLLDEAYALKQAVAKLDPSAYRKERDSARREVAQATRDVSPKVAGIPALPAAGMMLAQGPMAETVPARLLAAAYGGGLNALGSTEADLTKGDVAGVASDVGMGATASAAGAGVGEAIGAPLRALGRSTAREAQAAAQAEKDAIAAARLKALKSAGSALGGETSAGFRTLEQAERVLSNPTAEGITPEMVQQAQTFLASPEAAKLRATVLQSAIARGYGQAERINAAREAVLQAALENDPALIAAAAAEKLKPSTQAADFAGKAWRSWGQRALLGGAGAGVGATGAWLLGEDPKKGAALGGVTGWAMPPGALQMLRNAVRDPAKQAVVNALASKAFESGATGLSRVGMAEGGLYGQTATALNNAERERINRLLEALRSPEVVR